jgi:hypothetical protein
MLAVMRPLRYLAHVHIWYVIVAVIQEHDHCVGHQCRGGGRGWRCCPSPRGAARADPETGV